jgi:hypothetical protein
MSVQPAVSVDEICARGTVTGEDVARLRRLLFTDAAISAEEAVALFRINTACARQDPSWREFYIEAITDFLINDVVPRGYLTNRNAEWLVAHVAPQGTVRSKVDFELLVNLLDKARWAPESLVRLALEQVLKAIETGTGPLRTNSDVPPRRVTESDVEVIRRIVYAFGGDGNIAITRAEAEVLFRINDIVADTPPCPIWSELFVKALANCVMAASGYAVPSREEALRREAWLESRNDIELSSILTSFKPGYFETLYRAFTSEEAALARLERQRIEIITNEEVTQGEIAWLADHLGRDGNLSANERLLIAFLKRESPRVHPSLDAIIARWAEAA